MLYRNIFSLERTSISIKKLMWYFYLLKKQKNISQNSEEYGKRNNFRGIGRKGKNFAS